MSDVREVGLPAGRPPGEDASPDAASLAERHGLTQIGVRPGLGAYLRQLWSARHFVTALSTSRAYAKNSNNYLGQAWAVLNPIVFASVYFLVFGVILDTSKGIQNYVAFLVVGIFMFRFTSSSVTAGAKSVVGNLPLVRSMHFPRAVLPSSAALTELATLVPVLGVMILLVLITGEPVSWTWLALPAVVLMQYLFNTGISFAAARVMASARDLLNLLPFALRLMLYVSGVFFSIEHYVGNTPIGLAMQYQPVAVYLTLTRASLMSEFQVAPTLWLAGGLWALLALLIGFVVFWRAEERYGRD